MSRNHGSRGVVLGWEVTEPAARLGFVDRTRGAGKARCRRLITDDTDGHVLVVAPTGAGKGRSVMIPTLLTSTAPAVVIDVKGEAAAVTAQARRAMGHDVRILDPFGVISDASDGLNPLDLLDPAAETFEDDALELAEAIVGPEQSTRERFWDNWARSLISAVVTLCAQERGQRGTLGNVWNTLTEDHVDLTLASLVDVGKLTGVARNHVTGYLSLPERETRPSVLGTVQQHLRLFGGRSVQQAVGHTSIDLAAFQHGAPQTVYLVIPPNKLASHAPLLRIWIWALLALIMRRERNPAVPTLFMLDEMAQLGGLASIEQAVTLLRGYGVRLVMMIQNLAQLQRLYPLDGGTIASNCGTIVTFGMTSAVMARPMAECLGDVTAEWLLALDDGQLAVRSRRRPTALLLKADYLKDRRFAGKFNANPRFRRVDLSNGQGAIGQESIWSVASIKRGG